MKRKYLYITFGTIPALLWGVITAGILIYIKGMMWSGYPVLAAVWGYMVAPVHDRTTQGRKRLVTAVLLLIGLIVSGSLFINILILDQHSEYSLNKALLLVFFTTGPGIVALHYLAESVIIWKNTRASSVTNDG